MSYVRLMAFSLIIAILLAILGGILPNTYVLQLPWFVDYYLHLLLYSLIIVISGNYLIGRNFGLRFKSFPILLFLMGVGLMAAVLWLPYYIGAAAWGYGSRAFPQWVYGLWGTIPQAILTLILTFSINSIVKPT